MESYTVREQLIAAGIVELESHGIADFSLRRVAAACNLSCAAPYKHFKGKDELIEAIFSHIHSQLNFLLEQVGQVHTEPAARLIESCLAYIRFCIANPHFRAVLMLAGRALPLADTVNRLLPACLPKLSEQERQDRGFCIRSIAYGATLMLESGELCYNDDIMRRIRESLQRELQ
jgi:AcrR family transcriptional regulator